MRLARTHDADTQRHAAFAIGCLAGNARCQRQIGESGGLRPLIKCGYSRSTDLQQLVMRAVGNLALDPQLNAQIVHEGGSQLVQAARTSGAIRRNSSAILGAILAQFCAIILTAPTSTSRRR